MFDFLKKDSSKITEIKEEILAAQVISEALIITNFAQQNSINPSSGISGVFVEASAFMVFLTQATAQDHYNFRSESNLMAFINRIIRRIGEFDHQTLIASYRKAGVEWLNAFALQKLADQDFTSLVLIYCARDQSCFGITDKSLEQFCIINGYRPSLIKGSGVMLGLVLFQMRLSSFAAGHSNLLLKQQIVRITSKLKIAASERISNILKMNT